MPSVKNSAAFAALGKFASWNLEIVIFFSIQNDLNFGDSTFLGLERHTERERERERERECERERERERDREPEREREREREREIDR